MQTDRSLEIDVFRGFALIFIVVDHIAGGMLAWTTLRNVAVADATEVFVFLAGLVTAMAYTRLAARKGEAAADRRFVRRSLEIYRAFVVLAGLMFASGGLVLLWGVDTPSLGGSQIKHFLAAPLRSVYEVLTLQRQPFLADILPMYAFFALLTPLAIRLARRSWMWLLAASGALWLAAPWLLQFLPITVIPHWAFNPFAWQAVFVLGLIVGLYPDLPQRPGKRMRQALTLAAGLVFLAGAVFSLFSFHAGLREIFLSTWFEHGLQTFSKTNASAVRIINFLAIAWLVHAVVKSGVLTPLFKRLTLVALVGKNGLVCFVGGAVISVLAEALSYALSGGAPVWYFALPVDILAVAALIGLALVRERMVARQRAPAKTGAVVHGLPGALPVRAVRHNSGH